MNARSTCPQAILALCLLSLAAATDPWATLGLQRGADEAQIKRAYRSLALKLHPDKNPSAAAQEQWLQVQAAYEELTERGADAFTRLFRQHPAAAWADAARQRAAQQTAWREAHARQRQRIHIESAAEELDSSAFARRVLAADHRPGGQPWVVQLYAHDSPFCRAVSSQWEAALREVGSLLSFGRINVHEQPMLVRFVASHLRRLFRSPQPWLELPLVFGLPRGCFSMRCAVVFSDQLTSQALQRWAGTHLLRLPALPPLSSRLLVHWCRALQEGQLGVLAVLREGQPQPLHLLEGVRTARGSIQAAAAVWRPSDRAVWQAAVGDAAPPLMILCKGPAAARRLVAVRSSSLTDSSAWAAELQRHLEPNHSQGPSQGSSRPAGLFALAAAHALLAALHAASRLDLAARRCTQGLQDIAEDTSWRQWALGVLGLASLWGFKRLLDAFSATDDEYAADGSPLKKPRHSPQRASASSSSAAARIRAMQHTDWEPTPGRFVVLLPLPGQPTGSAGGSTDSSRTTGSGAAAAALQRLETLAALFRSERRLMFRLTSVSGAFEQLGPAAATAGAAGPQDGTDLQQQQQQQQQQLAAYVLHPRRGRYQLLPLADTQAAVLRLEEVLDGGGSWLGAAH